MKYFFLLLFSCLLFSCDFLEKERVTISFPSLHLWESEEEITMWYQLKYFDGATIQSKTLMRGERSVEVFVKRGSTTYYEAIPEGQFHPFGGMKAPWQTGTVYLTQEGGRLADVLLEVAEHNPSLAAHINVENIIEMINIPFDEDKLLFDLQNGEYHPTHYNVKKQKVVLSALPEGRYLPETDDDPSFFCEIGEEITVELFPGIHRFWSPENRFLRSVAVYPSGEVKSVDTYPLLL